MSSFNQIRGLGSPGRMPARPMRAVRPSLNFSMLCLLLVMSGAALNEGWFPDSPLTFVFVLTGWLVSLCLHEFGHAYAAWRGGDDTMPSTGYLTLDPMRYAHPMMSVVIPLLLLSVGCFAFPGGAVLVDHSRLRGPRWASIVSAAGPAANLGCILAIAVAFAVFRDEAYDGGLWPALAMLAFLQVTALLINLLPIPGIDGFGILRPFLPPSWREAGDRISGFSPMILLAVLFMTPVLSTVLVKATVVTFVTLGIDLDDFVIGWKAFSFWN